MRVVTRNGSVLAGEIQVCERQQREHLGSILTGCHDSAIFAIAELVLHGTRCSHPSSHFLAHSRSPQRCKTRGKTVDN